MSSLESGVLEKMRIGRSSVDEIERVVKDASSGYIIANGSKLRIVG